MPDSRLLFVALPVGAPTKHRDTKTGRGIYQEWPFCMITVAVGKDFLWNSAQAGLSTGKPHSPTTGTPTVALSAVPSLLWE